MTEIINIERDLKATLDRYGVWFKDKVVDLDVNHAVSYFKVKAEFDDLLSDVSHLVYLELGGN